MPIKASMWVHGTIAEAEDLTTVKIDKRGWGTTFTGAPRKSNWFHFPVPSPPIPDDPAPGTPEVIVISTTATPPEDDIPRLAKVWVFYKTPENPGAASPVIKSIHLYDGGKRIKVFDNLSLSGDHSDKPDAQNSWEIKPPLKIKHGLGVSVNVTFPGPKPKDALFSNSYDILFKAVGADF